MELESTRLSGEGLPKASKLKLVRRGLTLLALFVLFTALVLLIGSAVEMKNVRNAPSTLYFYTTPKVCGVDASANSVVTYANTSESDKAGSLVAHCGDCGFCSNRNDINIYNVTKNTLTKTSTNCAMKAFLGGASAVEECFDEDVGFTQGCNKCWVDNVMCDMKSCVFTCLKMIVTGERNNAGKNRELNDCLLCDEKLCGPAFISCAGANRRRSGIVSDIGRDDEAEVCKDVGLGWWNGLS